MIVSEPKLTQFKTHVFEERFDIKKSIYYIFRFKSSFCKKIFSQKVFNFFIEILQKNMQNFALKLFVNFSNPLTFFTAIVVYR